MTRLTAADASFLYVESASGPMHISSILTIEGEVPFETVLQHFAERIHLVPQYRRKLAQTPLSIAHPAWIDDPDFDLRNHVQRVGLPPGATEQDAIDEATRLNEHILDRALPLWQVWVIEGVPGRTYLLQMTHHAMIDGASGVELLTIMFDFEPKGRNIEPELTPWEPAAEPSRTTLLGTALRDNMKDLQETDWSRLFPRDDGQRRLMRRAGRVFGEFVTRPAITAPFNGGLVGPKRRLRTMSVPFAELREVRRSLGGTINDVVLTIVSEAVARYLDQKGEDTTDQHLRIMCPVNVRTEDQKGALGNQVSAIFPMLPAWPMVPEQRLTVVCSEMNRIKENQSAQALALLQEIAPPIWPTAMLANQWVGSRYDPTALIARLPRFVQRRPRLPNYGINFVCTNVPGVQMPQYLCGHEVLAQTGVLCLLGNLGLGVTILSYNQKLDFGFISEPNLLPDVELMVAAAEAAFDELLASARERLAKLSA